MRSLEEGAALRARGTRANMSASQNVNTVEGLQGTTAPQRRSFQGPQRLSPYEIAAFSSALEQVTNARDWGKPSEPVPPIPPTRARGINTVQVLSFLAVGLQAYTAVPFQQATAIPQNVATYYSGIKRAPYDGLRLGQRDQQPHGPIAQLQTTLKRWHPGLELEVTGKYDEATRSAVLLFKSLYSAGRDGQLMDSATARKMASMGDSPTYGNSQPAKPWGSRIVFAAAADLGRGVDADGAWVQRALTASGAAVESLPDQPAALLALANQGNAGLRVVSEPRPGDLVFYGTSDDASAAPAASGSATPPAAASHVGIFVGDSRMLVPSGGQSTVELRTVQSVTSQVLAYARPRPTFT